MPCSQSRTGSQHARVIFVFIKKIFFIHQFLGTGGIVGLLNVGVGLVIVGSRDWVNRCLWELGLRLCRIVELWDCKIVGLRDCWIRGLHDFKILESRI